MKHTSYYFFHTCLFLCVMLTACTAKRSAIKAVSESETASVTESRLTFYRTIESLSRQFALSFDSATIWVPEFPTAYTSGMIGCTETPSDSINSTSALEADKRPSSASRLNRVRPHAIKVYGLHVTANSEKMSVNSADLKDSVATVTQSQKHKSANKQTAASSPAVCWPYIFIILILCVTIAIILIRYIHKHTFLA